MLKEAYGENAMKPTTIYKWMASKKKEEKNTRGGRPFASQMRALNVFMNLCYQISESLSG